MLHRLLGENLHQLSNNFIIYQSICLKPINGTVPTVCSLKPKKGDNVEYRRIKICLCVHCVLDGLYSFF